MAPLVLFEPHGDPARIAPSQPLGPWAQAPLRRLLDAVEPERPVVLDLRDAPLEIPEQIAVILWADDTAADLGLRLEVLAGDMASAELLDFAGLRAPVYSALSAPPSRAGLAAPHRRFRARRA
jgi:hypothetical protein